MATKWRTVSSGPSASSNTGRSAASAMRGSMVPPLFEEMTTSVVAGLLVAIISRNRTGESESSVLKLTRLRSGLLYLVMVMGAWVEPPWPISTTVSMPLATTSSAKV